MPINTFGQEVGPPIENWRPPSPPPRTSFEGHRVRIEPLDPDHHASTLFEAYAAAADGRDWTYLAVERFDRFEAFRAFVAQAAKSDDPLHFAIVDRTSSEALGVAAFMRIDPQNGVIELGAINFSQRLKRSAAGTEAIFLFMCRAFDDLGYRRLEWKCDSLNLASRRAACRYGFTFEGIFRQAVVIKGRNRDTAWYAMTNEDWPMVRAAFLSWLNVTNFDAAGQQIMRLDTCRATTGDPSDTEHHDVREK